MVVGGRVEMRRYLPSDQCVHHWKQNDFNGLNGPLKREAFGLSDAGGGPVLNGTGRV